MFINFLRSINKIKFSLLTLLLLFGILGYFLCDYGYNNLVARYEYSFSATSEPSYILEKSYYDDVIKEIEEYNSLVSSGQIEGKKISYAKINYEEMLKTAKLRSDGDGIYVLSIKQSYFKNLARTSDGSVNYASDRVKTYFNLFLGYGEIETTFVQVNSCNYVNPFIVGAISFGITALVFLITYYIMYRKGSLKEVTDISDNINIFKTPFHKKYWQDSTLFFKKVKNIAFISVLFALMMASKLIPIPSGFGSLGIGFGYLFFAIISACYGPLAGIVIGILSDNLGYFLFPNGYAYFPGYMLDSLLAGFIYGICFYKTKITFTKCLWARVFVNLFINVLIGSFWWKIIYGLDFSGYISYVFFISLPKNLIYLIPQSIMLYLLFIFISKPLARVGLIDKKVSDNIMLF